MKLVKPFTGEYDPDAGSLTFAGKTTAGNKTEVILPVESINEFLVFLAGCFAEKGENEGSLRGTVLIHSIGFSMHELDEQTMGLVLRVQAAGMAIRFLMPTKNLTEEQMRTAGEHMIKALDLLQKSNDGATLN